MNKTEWKQFEKKYDEIRHELTIFMDTVESFFANHPKLQLENKEKIHSTKKRLKNKKHLKEKIIRKRNSETEINLNNFYSKITDLSGVRILLLFQEDFQFIDDVLREKINNGDWFLAEKGKAYTWDPESEQYFKKFDLDVSTKSTNYTSVHYLIKPRSDSPICCEIQVRTLFEEIWGEVDHRINYPNQTKISACKEQIRVLSKIVGAGSRLVDSIQRSIKK
ncbi:RelA/SpoT domain-containing protein [Oceanibaculum pacificum]|uniref:RelA/SpoT domain-containing protein n=1 Tax=Oceanibaculum pacificum TaxID=580166 RepID=UPI0009FFC774|nr:RelA/SpoT domain-containing protein [Oceanibaculum pacificum]